MGKSDSLGCTPEFPAYLPAGSFGRLKTHEALTAAGVPCTLVLDTAVAYIMDRIDLVLVGSEAVVESGGLINAVGSYQMAIVAKALNKPLYALAERHVPMSC